MHLIDNWQFSHLNSGIVKLFLLSLGVRMSHELLLEISNNKIISKSHYYYDASNPEELCKQYHLPSEILLPDDVETSFYLSAHSPLEIVKNDKGKFELLYLERKMSDLEFNYAPDFFEASFSDGTLGKQYASMYGRHILGLFLSGYCDYPAKGVGCRFCSIRSTREDLGKPLIYSLTPERLTALVDVMSPRDLERITYVMYTAGTYPDVDAGIFTQGTRVKAMAQRLPKKVKHHLTTMPPKDFKKIEFLKEIGLDTLAYDIEVYHPLLFEYFCPGKEALYGREKMFSAIEQGVKIFGHSKLKVGFVGGLEPLVSMKEGMARFARVGAGISINVFHPDTKTEMENYPRPTPEYILEMVLAQRDLYKQHDLIPVFPNGGRRSSLDSEVYRGFFNDF